MAASSAAALARIQRSGMGVIVPAAGLAILAAILTPTGPRNAQVSTKRRMPRAVQPANLQPERYIGSQTWHSLQHCENTLRAEPAGFGSQTVANPFEWGVLLAGLPAVPPALSEYAAQAAAAVAAAQAAVAVAASRPPARTPAAERRLQPVTAQQPRRVKKYKTLRVKVCPASMHASRKGTYACGKSRRGAAGSVA